MKIILLALLVGTFPTVRFQQFTGSETAIVAAVRNAKFNWTETTYDFGKIARNKPVTYKFEFSNNGTEPLVISEVKASCGCTVTNYSKDPIAPGAIGFVTATYNAANPGVFSKTVTINANTDDTTVLLTVKGEVTE